MAKYSSADVGFFLVDGYSILGDTTEISDEKETLFEETTPLGASVETHAPVGLSKVAFSQNGFYNDAANASNDALAAMGTAGRVLCLGYEGNTIGKHFVGFSGLMESHFKRIASRGALHKANADWAGSGQREDGRILHALGAETAAGDTTGSSVDNAASSANGGSGYLQVSALDLDGYDDVTITIQDSADNNTFADLVTFTAVTAAPDAERKTVAGTVDRYLAVAWAYTGAGTSPSVTFMAGFARG